jgi:hypothetical protein
MVMVLIFGTVIILSVHLAIALSKFRPARDIIKVKNAKYLPDEEP